MMRSKKIWEYKVWYNLESEMGHKFKVLPFKWVMTEPKFNPRIGKIFDQNLNSRSKKKD